MKPVEIAPAQGKLGVMLVGLGAVSTTFIAGVLAIRKGLARPIGSLTQMGTLRLGKRTEGRSPKIKDVVSLAGLDDLVFTGWDIFEEDCYAAARTAGVLEKDLLEQIRPELQAISPLPAEFDPHYVKRLDGPNVKKGANKRDLAEQVIEDIRRFKKDHGLDRMVMVWCGSTEVFMKESAAHQSIEAFEKALEANDPAIPSSMVYTYAALMEDVPYANGAPNLSVDIPAMMALAQQRRLPRRESRRGCLASRAGIPPTSSATAMGRCWTIRNPSRRRKRARSPCSTTSFSRSCIRSSIAISVTSCGSTTIRRAATTKRDGTTSIWWGGSATRCS